MSELAEKEARAIDLLRKLSSEDPLYIAYSGGKDSDVIRILAEKGTGISMNELSKDEAYAVAEFIDTSLLTYIREDEDIDSMLWLRNVIFAFEKLRKYGGYEPLTYPNRECEEKEDRHEDISESTLFSVSEKRI